MKIMCFRGELKMSVLRLPDRVDIFSVFAGMIPTRPAKWCGAIQDAIDLLWPFALWKYRINDQNDRYSIPVAVDTFGKFR